MLFSTVKMYTFCLLDNTFLKGYGVKSMDIRTDLVSEQRELHTEAIRGAVQEREYVDGVLLERVRITENCAAKALQRPVGTYITVKFGDLAVISDHSAIRNAVIRALCVLLPDIRDNVLVVGLGNSDITPDAIGPMTADRMLATRHIGGALSYELGLTGLKSVSAIIPGVLGKTGIEAVDIIKGTVERTHPQAVILIDALAARRTERLCRTVQLCDTGIAPGSGVNNTRLEISPKVLGVPVIAVGVPTVVDVASLICDYTGHTPERALGQMMVTPKEIDLLIRRSAELLAEALNMFLQPELDEKTLRALV